MSSMRKTLGRKSEIGITGAGLPHRKEKQCAGLDAEMLAHGNRAQRRFLDRMSKKATKATKAKQLDAA